MVAWMIKCLYANGDSWTEGDELGLPYNDDEEWVEYIKGLQEKNAERCQDCKDLLEVVEGYKVFINNTSR